MPTTLRNTDILFNDSSTQSSAAYIPPALTAGLFWEPSAVLSANTLSTSYALSREAVIVQRSGTVRTRLEYGPASDNYTLSTAWYRVFINGVAGVLRFRAQSIRL